MPHTTAARPRLREPRGFVLPFTPERPLFHVHVPKCGGQSVDAFLQQLFLAEGVHHVGNDSGRLREDLTGLGRYPCYSGHIAYRLRELLPPQAAVMTILRDPVDRAVSCFYFLRAHGREFLNRRWPGSKVARCLDLPLPEFLRAEPAIARAAMGNVQTAMFSQRAPLDPSAARDRPDLNGKRPTRVDLAVARRNLERCEFVGLTERLGESLRLLCRMCGWPEPDDVPHVNRTPTRPAAAAIEPEARAILEQWTALDAELYQFARELYADRLRDTPAPRLPPAPRGVELTFDRPVPGWGWSEPAAGPHGHFRWTGRTAWLEVRLAGRGGLDVTVDVPHVFDPAQLDGLTAEVNGRPVPLIRCRHGAGHRFEGRVFAEVSADGRYRLVLRVAMTVRPAEVVPGSKDTRELGVAVSRVALGFAHPAARPRVA
jgi:hypothetical protein